MLRPDGFRGAAFGAGEDGDGRSDEAARRRISGRLGISADWATVRQVHGRKVVTASAPGDLGEADAIITTAPDLPVAVATADCLPIVVESEGAVAVIHAGWRGLDGGVIEATLDAFAALGELPQRAAIGPGIGPCCYEVGPDVAGRFEGFTSLTGRGTVGVDLVAAARHTLERAHIDVWAAGGCTMTDESLHSYRRNGTARRQVTVGWLPQV